MHVYTTCSHPLAFKSQRPRCVHLPQHAHVRVRACWQVAHRLVLKSLDALMRTSLIEIVEIERGRQRRMHAEQEDLAQEAARESHAHPDALAMESRDGGSGAVDEGSGRSSNDGPLSPLEAAYVESVVGWRGWDMPADSPADPPATNLHAGSTAASTAATAASADASTAAAAADAADAADTSALSPAAAASAAAAPAAAASAASCTGRMGSDPSWLRSLMMLSPQLSAARARLSQVSQ